MHATPVTTHVLPKTASPNLNLGSCITPIYNKNVPVTLPIWNIWVVTTPFEIVKKKVFEQLAIFINQD